MRQDKDRVGKWPIGRHGDAILKLAGLGGFTSWRPLTPETVAPRRLPDGLIEAQYPGEEKPRLTLVEVEAFPGKGVDEQVFDDLMLLAVERGAVPEVVMLVLRPRVRAKATGRAEMFSPSKRTRLSGSWPVTPLWELDADALLADGDVGLVPWVPLAHSDRPAGEVLAACRDRIAAVPDPTERAGLLAVTSILVKFVSPGGEFQALFQGAKTMFSSVFKAMLEEPEYAEWREEMKVAYLEMLRGEGEARARREGIASALEARFGPVPADRLAPLAAIDDGARLKALLRLAVTCPDLETFLAELADPPAAG